VKKAKKGSDPPRGVVRAVGLAAAILNHSDDDRGEHDTWRWWMERKTGRIITFTDASNSRYGSFGDGAIILLLFRVEVREYLVEMRAHKTSQTFVNIQKNVYELLDDLPTLTGLAVMALYTQAISHPFMAHVRLHINDNSLLMGPIYERVKAHAQAIADAPDLVLSSKALPKTGSVFGTEVWDASEIMYVIQALRQQDNLPNLEPLFIAFVRGASKTMERLTKEYAPDSVIASLTPSWQRRGRCTLVNDENEGALVQTTQMKCMYPNMSDAHRNRPTMSRSSRPKYSRSLRFTGILASTSESVLAPSMPMVTRLQIGAITSANGMQQSRTTGSEHRRAKTRRTTKLSSSQKSRSLTSILPLLRLSTGFSYPLLTSRSTRFVLSAQSTLLRRQASRASWTARSPSTARSMRF
jgi:hypothetical protein